MKKYIPLDSLVAEIERLKKNEGWCQVGKDTADVYYARGFRFACERITSFIDTLEVKESEEEKLPTWKKVGSDVGQTILYMDGAESYLERFGYRISLNELDKLPKENTYDTIH